jgi:hypothetical protein
LWKRGKNWTDPGTWRTSQTPAQLRGYRSPKCKFIVILSIINRQIFGAKIGISVQFFINSNKMERTTVHCKKSCTNSFETIQTFRESRWIFRDMVLFFMSDTVYLWVEIFPPGSELLQILGRTRVQYIHVKLKQNTYRKCTECMLNMKYISPKRKGSENEQNETNVHIMIWTEHTDHQHRGSTHKDWKWAEQYRLRILRYIRTGRE